MTFMNKKEEVLDIKLTQYGKKLLSQGVFDPAYYTFHDEGVLYDSEYASDDEVEESCEDGGFHQFNERSNSNITGLHSTVEVRGIKTKMEEIEFAYCEHPRGWGVIDGEGLCTVKVDGARVGISYEIIINTPRLVQIVNQGVEIVKNESTRDELTAKFQTSLEERRKASASADENNSEFATPVLSPSG